MKRTAEWFIFLIYFVIFLGLLASTTAVGFLEAYRAIFGGRDGTRRDTPAIAEPAEEVPMRRYRHSALR
jgi:hypothetical protein